MKNRFVDHKLWMRLAMDRLAAPVYGGIGTILSLHRVRPDRESAVLAGNRNLEITPEALNASIDALRRARFSFVSLAEAIDSLKKRRGKGRFVVFTLDDGYRDNLEHAADVFTSENVPFTVYIATCFPDKTAVFWWYEVERLLLRSTAIRFGDLTLSVRTPKEQNEAFEAIAPGMMFATKAQLSSRLDNLLADNGTARESDADHDAMTWDQVRMLAAMPLSTIGAHTVNHLALSRLSPSEARSEMSNSVSRLEAEIGQPVSHFAYPYGGRAAAGEREFSLANEVSLQSAVTTRHGNIVSGHSRHLHALPRVPLTRMAGETAELLPLWTSGLIACHENRFRRLIVD